MKKLLLLSVSLLVLTSLQAQHVQQLPSKWDIHFNIGQYPLSITPSFNALHLGVNAGVSYRWNNNIKHQLHQTGNVAFFHHRYFQNAIQLYTETSYELRLSDHFKINPISLGGGYVMSISDMNSVKWNATTQQYEAIPALIRNNWMIALGAGLGYESKIKILDRPLSFQASYRLQIQGVVMRENVPVVAYSPMMLGVSVPIHKPLIDGIKYY